MEPRPFGPDGKGWTCALCRALDRIRSLVVQLPSSSSVAVLHELRNLESNLTDWLGFGGSPPTTDGPAPPLPPEPSLNQLLRPQSKARPGPSSTPPWRSGASQSESRAPLPRRHNVGTSGPSPPPFPPASAASGSRGGGRKKTNKGVKRKHWQAARQDIREWRERGAAEPQPVASSSESDLN